MVAQKGRDLLLKIDNGTGFASVAGLRSKRLSFNAALVDVTDAESAGRWRELLGGAGVQRAAVSGSGIFKDQASDALVRSLFFAARSSIGRWSSPISAPSPGRSRSRRSNIPARMTARCCSRSRWNRPVR